MDQNTSRYLHCAGSERTLVFLQLPDILLEFIMLDVIHQMNYVRSQRVLISIFSSSATTGTLRKTRFRIEIIPELKTCVGHSTKDQQ